MNINAVRSSTIKSIQKVSFKSNNDSSFTKPQAPDEFVSEQNAQKKKKKNNIWTFVVTGAIILALITDIIVEHKIRVEEKAKKEAIQKEKELIEKLKKEAEEKAKKLEEEIEKQKDALEKTKGNGNSGNSSGIPEVNVEPPKS